MQTIELNKIYNEDCLEGMNRIPEFYPLRFFTT